VNAVDIILKVFGGAVLLGNTLFSTSTIGASLVDLGAFLMFLLSHLLWSTEGAYTDGNNPLHDALIFYQWSLLEFCYYKLVGGTTNSAVFLAGLRICQFFSTQLNPSLSRIPPISQT
jgi:hypothetical protein